MKQIKKFIFQAAIMILLVAMPFFAWQKLVKTTRDTNEVERERKDTKEVERERRDTKEIASTPYHIGSAPLKKWRA